MQPVDRNIHMLFDIKTYIHTNTSSIKTTIFCIMKTSHNLNNAHAYDSLIILFESYPLVLYEAYPRVLYDTYPLFIMGLTPEFFMRLTLEFFMRLTFSLLWGLPSSSHCEAYPQLSMLMLYALLFKFYNLLFANYAFFKKINQSMCIFNNLLYIIKSQLQHTFIPFK
jgi:hypothetical protein